MEMVSHCNASFLARRSVDNHPSAWVRHYGVRALDALPMPSIPSGFRQNIHRSAGYYAINAHWDMASIPEEPRRTWLSHMGGFGLPVTVRF